MAAAGCFLFRAAAIDSSLVADFAGKEEEENVLAKKASNRQQMFRQSIILAILNNQSLLLWNIILGFKIVILRKVKHCFLVVLGACIRWVCSTFLSLCPLSSSQHCR